MSDKFEDVEVCDARPFAPWIETGGVVVLSWCDLSQLPKEGQFMAMIWLIGPEGAICNSCLTPRTKESLLSELPLLVDSFKEQVENQ